MNNIRVSLKWKIFIGGLGLSLAIVTANVIYSTHMIHQAAWRHHELEQLLRRYAVHQRNASSAYAAAAEAWAVSSRELRDALARGDDDAARPLIAQVQGSLEEDLHPDFIVFVDKHGDATLTPSSPLDKDDVKAMALFGDLKNDRKIKDALLVLKRHAYLVNGVPIIKDGANVGALVVGIKLERMFDEFRAQSDEDPRAQADFALVTTSGVTASSSAAFDLWDDIARVSQKDPPDTVEEGGERLKVFRLPGHLCDVASEIRNGYDGNSPGVVGTIYALRDRADRIEQIDGLIRDNLVVGGLAMIFGFIASFVLALGITRPVKRLIEATDEIARGEGDLSRRLTVNSNDELGDLANNLNHVFANLQVLATEVQHASQQVGGSSSEISASSRQMLAGAKEQAIKIESSTAAVTELSSSIQQVADNAIQATKVAKDSGEQVQGAIDGMARIRSTVEGAAEKIHDLGESGKRIGNIVEVIRQISEQTSLLALNASIEAAHAGEQGRGFAVVADEVSSLAKRVGQSAKDIEDLIATIKDQTAEAVMTMQAGTREVEGGTRIVVATLQSLRKIVEVIQDTASAVQEQAVVSDEIARNMDAVEKIAQEVLASSEAAVAHGENLHALAQGLEQSVKGFRLGDSVVEVSRGKLPPASPKAALPLPGAHPVERRRSTRG